MGWASIPAKMAANRTETKVKKAERVASLERVSNVRGREQKKERTAQIAEKPTVHTAWPLMVFRYLAPVRTWRPWACQSRTLDGSCSKPYLDEGIVEQEHGCGKVPDPSPSKVEHLTDVTNISKFGVTETEFPKLKISADSRPRKLGHQRDVPNNQGGVQHGHGNNHSDN